MSGNAEDRRRYFRLVLTAPMSGRAGTTRVLVSDMSERGLRIIHAGRVPRVGETFPLIIEREMGGIELQCEVRRTQVRPSTEPGARKLFESGLCIVRADQRSLTSLGKMLQIEGRKACAIPPVAGN